MDVVTEPGPGFRGTFTMADSLFNMTGRWGWNPRLPGRYPVSDPATDGALRPGVTISSTFYMQILSTKIPKVQKDTDNLTEFLSFWDIRALNLLVKHFVKLTPCPELLRADGTRGRPCPVTDPPAIDAGLTG